MILTLIFIRTMDLLRVLNSYFQPGPLVQYVTMNSKDLRAYNADTFSVRTASLCGWTVNAPVLCVELQLPKIPSGRTAVLILLFSCFKIKLLFHLSMPHPLVLFLSRFRLSSFRCTNHVVPYKVRGRSSFSFQTVVSHIC